MQRLLFICLITIPLLSCQTTESQTELVFHSNYQTDFNYPDDTENLVLVEQLTFEEPLHGASLRYENRFYDQDSIIVYTYPIRHFMLNNGDMLLNQEMRQSFVEIDETIERGLYDNRDDEVVEQFMLVQQDNSFYGLRGQTELTLNSGYTYTSYVYLFIQQDKFIKFRISLRNGEHRPTPDNMVNELLPGLSVPQESSYMAQLRAEHKQKFEQTLTRAILTDNSKALD